MGFQATCACFNNSVKGGAADCAFPFLSFFETCRLMLVNAEQHVCYVKENNL